MCKGLPRCSRRPVYETRIHRVNQCDGEKGPDAVFLLCPVCVAMVGERVGGFVADVGSCATCGRVVHELHHMFTVEFVRETHPVGFFTNPVDPADMGLVYE